MKANYLEMIEVVSVGYQINEYLNINPDDPSEFEIIYQYETSTECNRIEVYLIGSDKWIMRIVRVRNVDNFYYIDVVKDSMGAIGFSNQEIKNIIDIFDRMELKYQIVYHNN